MRTLLRIAAWAIAVAGASLFVVFVFLVASSNAAAQPGGSGCTGAFPFSEGSPWRVLDTTPEELTDTLWLIDLDPTLTLFSLGSEAPGCWAVAFSDTSPAGLATKRLLEVLNR